MIYRNLLWTSAAAAALGIGAQGAMASSHREAPAIAEDQYADNTDVYAFISPTNPDNLVIVANYVPLLIPSSGPNFYRFSEDVAYDIHIDNTGDAKDDLVYRFMFETSIRTGDTFLYNTGVVDSLNDPDLNVRQVYDVLQLNGRGRITDVIAADVPVAPWNVGDRTFPNNTYDTVASQAVTSTNKNVKLFAGPRDEPFFVDLHVFDLLGVGGAPTTDGINVMSIVIEVPITQVARNGVRPAAGATGPETLVGIHATASRPRKRVLRRDRDEREHGQFVQISRLGWPLVNEVVIPLKAKDQYNRSRPENDVSNFGMFILFPELTGLLNGVLNAGCPNTPQAGRTDIVGLLGANNNVTVADLLRIKINQGQTFADSVFPNGRKLTDDVTDTLLTVVCNKGTPVSDLVNANDKAFLNQFPYLASPHSGNPVPPAAR